MLGFRSLVNPPAMDGEPGGEVGPSFGLSAFTAASALFELVVGSMRCMGGRKLFVRRDQSCSSESCREACLARDLPEAE